MAEPPTLHNLEGHHIALLAPAVFHQTVMEVVMLHKVEASGIWIESQKLTDTSLDHSGQSMAPKTLVFFLPWHQVYWIMSSIDLPAISGTAAQL